MTITAAAVKKLRDKTGVGMMDCKVALTETDGDIGQAIEALRKKGIAKAAKKSSRTTNEGNIFTYVHAGGKLASMLELNCETDFVANTEDFQTLGHELAMHIAAAAPAVVKIDDLNAALLEKEKEIYKTQALNEGKPEQVVERIINGRVEKYYKEVVLLEQPYIKDDKLSVKDLLTATISKLGENISVGRFARFVVGEAPCSAPKTEDE